MSFRHKVTDALGIKRKSAPSSAGEPTAQAAAAGGAAAAAVAATTNSQPGPSTPGQSAPTSSGPSSAAAKGTKPDSGNVRPGAPAPTHPGPPQYRVGNPTQGGVPSGRPGSAAGATSLQPIGNPSAGETPAAATKPPARRTRKARLRLSRLDPWSVMKTSFLFAIAAGIMLVVAVYAIWVVLSASGLFTSINDIVASVVSTPGDTTPFQVQDYLDTQRIMGIAALIACVDVVIFTALATLASFLYNLAATMLGGLEVTLAED